MKVQGKPTRTIWLATDAKDGQGDVEVIDQRKLPHAFVTVRLKTLDDAAVAIREMWIRGAPLIGATAAYGIALATGALLVYPQTEWISAVDLSRFAFN